VSNSALPLSIERRPFAAWPEAWWLHHGELELVFVPALARLVRVARGSEGANALWLFPDAAAHPVECWENSGGEKLWFWPQNGWRRRMGRGWPPPEQPAVGTRAEAWGLGWRLPVYAGFGLNLTREIRFAAEDPAGFRLVTRREVPPMDGVAPWSVTQIPKPATLRVGAAPGSAWQAMHAPPGAPQPEAMPEGGWRLECPWEATFKHGFAADTLEAPTPGGRLSIRALGDAGAWPAGAADAGVRAQVFAAQPGGKCLPSGTEPYVELEFVAPPGASEWTLEWHLDAI
jgi:hypothetical protein